MSGNVPAGPVLNGDREALSAGARRGLKLFRGKANCTACHMGPNFTDERFQQHRGRFAVAGKDSDRGAFKTPTLREIARTAPCMHDGSIATLEEVISGS